MSQAGGAAVKSLGQLAYEAHCEAQDIPRWVPLRWEDIGAEAQRRWEHVATVISGVIAGRGH